MLLWKRHKLFNCWVNVFLSSLSHIQRPWLV